MNGITKGIIMGSVIGAFTGAMLYQKGKMRKKKHYNMGMAKKAYKILEMIFE